MSLPEDGVNLKNQVKTVAPTSSDNPFLPQNETAYRRWREHKLDAYPTAPAAFTVKIKDPRALTSAEAQAISQACRKTNMAIYVSPLRQEDKAIPRRLGEQLGLQRLDSNLLADDDGITSLQTAAEKSQRGYIPYSNKRLLWHTDGYYNKPEAHIRAFILHCVSPAADGGENSLLDHEIAYLLLRDANPDFIRALMAPDAMTIPANTETGAQTRAAVTGPVFSIDARDGSLHMRYTARTRSIEWKQDSLTLQAVRFIENLLAGDSAYVFRQRMAAGQGLVCNNVLHNRTAFSDDVDKGIARLVYRARYYDRIAGTELKKMNGQDLQD
ncbi:MAG: TauD/TfdA family dioxygenase [Gammaproteobacteria bacterium]|nr:TauD/TfdA family dioxygenase [Gammaproteobacteria bacterium]